ncbi:Protein of unknown function [Frankineae bacterium MT45]|nr:Protein of unknown function [Frankineae bacterium MT45]
MATADSTPWEPPLAGSEVAHLLGALNRLRTTFRWKAGGLDAAGLNTRIATSSLTLGGLLKHLACVEDFTLGVKLSGSGPGEPWESAPWESEPNWDFTSAAADTPEALYALWDASVARSQQRVEDALAAGGLDFEAHVSNGEGVHASLRRLTFDLVEEYGRHTGHADLLREAVDGLVGEDPPAGWVAR